MHMRMHGHVHGHVHVHVRVPCTRVHARLVGREQRRRREGCGAHLTVMLGLAPLLLKGHRVDLPIQGEARRGSSV